MKFDTILIYLTFLVGLVFGVIATVLRCSGQDAANETAAAVIGFLLSGNMFYLRWLNNPSRRYR